MLTHIMNLGSIDYIYNELTRILNGGGEDTSPPEPLRSSVSKFRAQIYNPE